jgi:hypothetical protein
LIQVDNPDQSELLKKVMFIDSQTSRVALQHVGSLLSSNHKGQLVTNGVMECRPARFSFR